MASEYVMVLDAGSGGVKCFIVDSAGKVASKSNIEWVREEWNTELAWESIRKAITDALSKTNLEASSIRAVSTTSMREEFVLIDSNKKEIRFEMGSGSWEHGEELNNTHGKRMYNSSGHWPVPDWMAAAKLSWLRDYHPEILEKAENLLMISDWVSFRLCGVPRTEGSSACETSLFNILTNDWDWELINELKLPPHIFPEVIDNGCIIGEINDSVARETGLKSSTPVVSGGADTQCGLLGVGAVEHGEIVAIGGTTTPVQLVTDHPIFDKQGMTWTNRHVVDGRWIIESNAGRTGWVYRWFRDNIFNNHHPSFDFEKIDQCADIPLPGSNGLMVFMGPHVFKSSPPYLNGDRLGDLPVPPTIIGSSKFTKAELARAILEANCYAVRANIEQLSSISGMNFHKLGFCGGNSKSSLWLKIQANVLGIPVIAPKERDSTSIGAAMCAFNGVGMYQDIRKAIKYMVHIEEPVIPDIKSVEAYDKLYVKWMNARSKLSGIL